MEGHHQACTEINVIFRIAFSRKWGKRIEKSWAKSASGLGKDEIVEPACFQYLIPVYQLLVLPYDWSIVTVYFNT